MQKEPMTAYGYERICRELKELKEVERPQIVKEIDIARAHGDLKENAEYHAAKERQLFIEARIGELSEMLARTQVVDPASLKHDKISFGSTFKVMDIDSERTFEYTVVGASESNPDRGLISFQSPLVRQLLGKEAGDEVHVLMPSGEVDYEVLEVYYKEIRFE
ncbi:MAG: transcription elongation factor GreA [Wolinella sp.]